MGGSRAGSACKGRTFHKQVSFGARRSDRSREEAEEWYVELNASKSKAYEASFPDYAFRQSLSPLARKACEIVGRIRDEEQRTLWTAEFEDCLTQKTGANIYPGMMFSLAKKRMETTKLWQIIRKMPKGALLHAHMDAMVDLDYLFDVLLSTPGIHIYCNKSLSNIPALEAAAVKFRFLKAEKGMCSHSHLANGLPPRRFTFG